MRNDVLFVLQACQSDIQWLYLPGNETSFTFFDLDTDGIKYNFAVSAEFADHTGRLGSTGLSFPHAHCVYDIDKGRCV